MKRKIFTGFFMLCLILSLDYCLYYFFPQIDKDQMNILQLDHPFYRFGFHKNISVVLPFGKQSAQYYTNSLGMRDRCVRDVPSISGKHRILFIGDSFIEGVGCDYDSTFAGMLSHMVDTSRVEILNAGTRMYSPKLDYLRLKYLFEKEHTKVNEVYCALTSPDVMDELIFENFEPDTTTKPQNDGYTLLEKYKKHSVIWFQSTQWLANHYVNQYNLGKSNIFLYYINSDNLYNEETGNHFEAYRVSWSGNKVLSSRVSQKALTLTMENLNKIHKLCSENHIAFHIFCFPYGYTVSSEQSPENYKEMNTSFVSLFKNFSVANKIHFVNLFPLFTGEDEIQNKASFHKYFINGDEHWNEAGHKRVADSLLFSINNGQGQ